MFEAFTTGFLLAIQWPAVGYLLLGVLLGIWIGAVPGLGGILGLVVLLPFTFGMEPIPAFALLLGMFAVSSTSDTISSVLLGIPGTAASQATVLDGYPLAQQGQAARALGAAFTVSAFGGVFGALVLAISLPLILPIILSFASPELFMLGVLALTMVGSLSGKSIVKGLVVACLGVLLSTIGYADMLAIPRYWFGAPYLLDGLPIIPVVLGLFALPELLELAVRNASIARGASKDVAGGGLIDGVRDSFRNWWLAVRCAAIGTYVGMLPGLGAAIVDWVAYGHAVQSATDPSKFGKGDIRGVIAPEAANNATRGGALIPTVAFGIPGSLGTAILLGALLIQGLKPGPEMLTAQLHITFSMVWMIVIANIVVSILLMFCVKYIAKISFLPGHMIVPGVLLFVFMGAWLGTSTFADWNTLVVFGALGYLLKRGGWARPPLILALILGSLMENGFQISMRSYSGFGWTTRPIVLLIAALAVLTVLLAIRSHRKAASSSAHAESDVGEGAESNPLIALPLGLLFFGIFTYAAFTATQWPETVREFPLIASVLGLVLTLVALQRERLVLVGEMSRAGGIRPAWSCAFERAYLPGAAAYFGYLLMLMLVTLVIGQKLALPLLILVYLIRWGGRPWKVALAYAGLGWIFLIVFYDRVMQVFWYPSLLSSWLPEVLPDGFPVWLLI